MRRNICFACALLLLQGIIFVRGQADCTTAPDIANGRIRQQPPYVAGYVAAYDCDNGYEAGNAGPYVCAVGNVWNGPRPTCVFIPPITNNDYSSTGFPSWLEVMLACLTALFCLLMLALLAFTLWYCCCATRESNSVSQEKREYGYVRPPMHDAGVQADFVEYRPPAPEYQVPAFYVTHPVDPVEEEPGKPAQIYRPVRKSTTVATWMPHSHSRREDLHHANSSTK